MASLREVLRNHIDTIRDFVIQLLQIDSGIYDTTQLKTILQQPDTTVKLETDFLNSLLEAVHFIQEYLQLVRHWEDHTIGLLKNLQATPEEVAQFKQIEKTASEILQSKTLELDYLHWVLQDTAQHLDRLIPVTQDLIAKGPRLIELTDLFKGPFFTRTKDVVQVWMSAGRRDFFVPLVNLLQESHETSDPQYLVKRFARYLDTIAHVVSSTPMFVVDTSKTTSYSPSALKSTQDLVDQLLQGAENLTQFVQLRTESYLLLLSKQDALLRAALPPETPVAQVLITIGLNQNQSVEDFFPKELSRDTIPLAIKQAEEALVTWDATIEQSIPLLNKALTLNTFFQSPAIKKFLNADQERLEAYREWRPRIQKTFDVLKEAAKI